MQTKTLSDLGERRIINEILHTRYAKGLSNGRFGDDCALIGSADKISGCDLIATTDPCPIPMATILGFTDPYYRGWLLATINLSDLSAAGARPLGLLTSLVLPNETPIQEFIRLLDGIDACCKENNTCVVGGNLKEGSYLDVAATAFGYVPSGSGLSRSGCQPGDRLILIGDAGLFWAGVAAHKNGLTFSEQDQQDLLRNVLTPAPKLSVGQKLAERRLVTSCMDNSDGLFGSLLQLSSINNVRIELDFSSVQFPDIVKSVGKLISIDPVRFLLGWGDWQLIATAKADSLSEIADIALDCNTYMHDIGSVTSGTEIMLRHQGRFDPLVALDSERFTKESWFTIGIQAYENALFEGPLWQSENFINEHKH